MTWQYILKRDTTLLRFKNGLSFSPQEETIFNQMCKEGKEHIETELMKLNINREVPHAFDKEETVNILVANTALALGGAQAYDELSSGGGLPDKYLKYTKDIKRIFNEGIEICRDSKSAKTETGRKEEYIKLIKDIVEGTDTKNKLDLLNEKFTYEDFEKYIPLEDRTWKGDFNYAWNFKVKDNIKEMPPKMGETIKEYQKRFIDEGFRAF